jgi:hypothetical protein
MKTVMSPTFSLPTLKDGRKLDQVELKKFVPPPGLYSPKVNIGELTHTSAFKNAVPKSFYHHDRFNTS